MWNTEEKLYLRIAHLVLSIVRVALRFLLIPTSKSVADPNIEMSAGVSNMNSNTSIHSASNLFRNPFIFYPCVLFALWDAFTTAIGTQGILEGSGPFAIVGTVLMVLFVSAILMNSFFILGVSGEGPLPAFMRILFFAAIGYDVFTSFYGAKIATFSASMTETDALISQVYYRTTFAKWIVVFLMTLLSVSATMICAWVYYDKSKAKAESKITP